MQQSTSDPITAVCIVVDPNKCPPNYYLLLRSNDKKDECDLWKDGVFKSRTTRYLCYSRASPLHDSTGCIKEVLTDLVIQNDKEMPPPGYRLIDKTIDTYEKATNKKQICTKMLPVSATTDAISEIIILSKNKRAPPGYSSAGDVNGLLLCFKMSKIATSVAAATGDNTGQFSPNSQVHNGGQQSAESNSLTNWWGLPVSVQPRNQNPVYPHYSVPPPQRVTEGNSGFQLYDGTGCPYSYGRLSSMSIRGPYTTLAVPVQSQVANSTGTDINTIQNPLSGIPFRLNPKFADDSMISHLQHVPTLTYKSLVDIENEFSYAFNLENSTVSQSRI